jgi:hypothetical protein
MCPASGFAPRLRRSFAALNAYLGFRPFVRVRSRMIPQSQFVLVATLNAPKVEPAIGRAMT